MKFLVFKNGQLVKNFKPCGAYLFGTDGIAIRKARVVFKDGVITCDKANFETAGLALLWPVKNAGTILLPTTCLPEREKPYVLNVEIARAKLMDIITKREDWSYFSETASSDEAKKLFIKAIQNISDEAAASQFADSALEKALPFSENLALKHSINLFNKRVKARKFSRSSLGCNLDVSLIDNEKYFKIVRSVFGSVNIPVNWAKIEREKGKYDFSQIDKCIKALSGKRIVLGLGPVLKFSKDFLPQWLITKKHEFSEIRDCAYHFVTELSTRYAGIFKNWQVISGLNAYNFFGFSFDQILEVTRASNMAVKSADRRATKIIEIANPWGEYYSAVPNTIPPLVYIDMIVQSGINFDSFGLKMKFGKNLAGMHVRDLMQISAVLDYFSLLGKPLKITGTMVPDGSDNSTGDCTTAGLWKSQWDRKIQSQWIDSFYKIAFSKFFVESVTYSSLTDDPAALIPDSGLMTRDLQPKESFKVIQKLSKIIFAKP